jgi:CDP-L-myo-inositol myo-inositolphosphotransferase
VKAVILAAGMGSRMGGVPKPLVKVGGIEIILRTMKLLSPYVDEFIVVTGYFHDEIADFLKKTSFKYKTIKNEHPEWGNGFSLYLAKEYVNDRFIAVMGDHVYSKDFIDEAVNGQGLIGDAEPKFIDIEEATKVKTASGKVSTAGKDLEKYDCIDTGFFILETSIFEHIELMIEEVKNGSLKEIKMSEVISRAKIPVTLVSGKFWTDVDTREDVRRANFLLIRTSVKGEGDGLISRFFNRKISTRISALLVNTATPSQMTIVSFLIGVFGSAILVVNTALAAIIYQVSSILDGCDGEIARASLKQSKIGGYMDSILDRFVDFLFLTVLLFLNPSTLFPAIFAIFGSVMVSYSTEKFKAEFQRDIYREIRIMRYLPGKRDERIFIIMLFCLAGWIYQMFITIAVLTNLRIIATLLITLITMKGTEFNKP